jgi:hypothetical protein
LTGRGGVVEKKKRKRGEDKMDGKKKKRRGEERVVESKASGEV